MKPCASQSRSPSARYAHERGIVHRDLKPANVKVTSDDAVKILDFGLAKALEGDASSMDMANSPTITRMATQAGVLLGTAAYMSPEQAKAKPVDRRADIWAFGCVLYEMLTAKMVFHGETVTDTLAAIIKEEPDWSQLPAGTPIRVRVLLQRCLQKDPKQRLRDIGDARISLDEVLTGAAEPSTVAPTPVSARLGRQTLVVSLATLLLGAAIASLATWNLKPAPPQLVTRTVITLPVGQQLAGLGFGPAVALSPDGTRLAYVARQGGTQQLYLRAMDSLDAKPIAGTEGAVNPFFSPDGQWLGFFAAGKLKKVSVNGGAALTLGDAASPNGASWGSQGIIALAPTNVSIIQQTPDAAGTAKPLSRLEKGENSQRWPEFLPDGKAVLFAAGSTAGNWTNSQVAVQSLTGERRDLTQGTAPHYAPSGHLVYAQGGTLMAVPFDPQRLTVTGATVPVVDGVLQSIGSGYAQYSLSATGLLVYVPGGLQSNQSKLVWVNRNGAEQPLSAPEHAYVYPRLSPDSRRLSIIINEEKASAIWLHDLHETWTRLTFEGSVNSVPAWTPDGKRIAFVSNKEGQQNIFWRPLDGGGGLERLTNSEFLDAPMSFSPDGQLLAFIEANPTTGYDIWVLRLSDRKAQPFLRTPSNESAPQFSADGHWLAYVSDESGRFEVYVQPYPSAGGKWQVSADGGTEPVWNRNGRELFYRSGDKMMAVEITTQPGFSAGAPKMLFEGPYVPNPADVPQLRRVVRWATLSDAQVPRPGVSGSNAN